MRPSRFECSLGGSFEGNLSGVWADLVVGGAGLVLGLAALASGSVLIASCAGLLVLVVLLSR